MAIPTTTDWAKIRHAMLMVFFVSSLLASTVANGLTASGKQKRQLFREHLLPARGGKVPQDAFLLERVSLNRLNQLGVYNADGNLVEKRHHDHPHYGNHVTPRTIKIIVPSADNRYAEPAGRYSTPHIADTTYLIREPTVFVPFLGSLNNRLPVIPQESLKLVNYFQQRKKSATFNWQKPSSDGLLPQQIFAELTPYVRKLHELDGYQK